MIQKIKKPVSILLTVLMVFSVFAVVPFTASAATTGNFDNLYWNLDDNGLLTFSGSGAIPNYGFDWSGRPIKKIIINDSVTSLGDSAFRGNTQVKEVVFESNPVLDWDVFGWCYALESVTLPQNMETIGPGMFIGCTSLKTIELPSTIKKIGRIAFSQSALESLTVPEGVEIEENAFKECTSLQSLVLESSTPVSYNAGYLTTLGDVTTVTVSEGSHYDRKARTDYNLTPKEGADIPDWISEEEMSHFIESANLTFNYCINEEGMSEEEALAEATDRMPIPIEFEVHKTEIEAYDQIFRTGDTCPDVFGGATLKVALDDATIAAINAINAIGTVELTNTCKEKVDAARAAYDALNDVQKTFVPDETLATLEAAEDAMKVSVEWIDGNGNTLKTEIVTYGETPTYDGTTPEKAEDTENTYTFKGWDPAVAPVTGDVTYTAQFDATPKAFAASVTSNGTTTNYTDFGTALNAWTDGSTLTLLADVQMDSPVNVSGTRTLDLNGYGIKVTVVNKTVFNVSGNLTLNDSDATKIHKFDPPSGTAGLATLNEESGSLEIHGGYITGFKGVQLSYLFNVARGGSFTINGGNLIGNEGTQKVSYNGTVVISASGDLTINGGAIIYNKSGYWGTAISAACTLKINGGTIAHNYAAQSTAGIYCWYLEMKGGNVTDNVAATTGQSAGITVERHATFRGNPVIKNNTDSTGASNLNVYMQTKCSAIDSNLGENACIGITMSNPGVFTDSSDTSFNDPTKFFSDKSNYIVGKNADGQLLLGVPRTVTWKMDNGRTIDTTTVANGAITTHADPTKPDDDTYTYTFSGWTDGTNTYSTTATLPPVTADVTYTAKFDARGKKLIAGHSITLDGNIGINFYIDPSAAGMNPGESGTITANFAWTIQGPRVEVSAQSKTVNVTPQNYTRVGDRIKVTCYVCAAEMSCKVKATFNLKNESQTEKYCVRDYCAELLNPNSEASVNYKNTHGAEKYGQLTDLVTKMLDYGTKAQGMFEVNTSDPANSLVPTYSMQNVTEAMFKKAVKTASGTDADNIASKASTFGAKYYATSLFYYKDNKLRHYFIKDENGSGFNPSSYDDNQDNYFYYVEVPEIAPAKLDSLQTFTVGTTSFKYAALDYARNIVYNSSVPKTHKDLAMALYWYNHAANVFFNDAAHTHTPGAAVQENVVPASCSAEGSYDEVVYCTECGAELSRAAKTIDMLAHTIVAVAEVPATTEAAGMAAHYECSVCGKLFTDAEGNNETTAEALVIPQIVENVVDLSTLERGYEAQDGDVLINALDGQKYIRIADGATVKLRNANITCLRNSSSINIAGLTLLGDATIILEGTNVIRGGYEYCPGIHVPEGKTLTIDGTGSLDVSSNGRGFGCGIGSNDGTNCGNIVINGGNITAYAGTAAGIGAKSGSSCGNITINGGTVNATSGDYGAGIGSTLYGNSICGDITINGGVVNATANYEGPGIGSGTSANCGNITITGGTVTAIGGEEGAGIGTGNNVSICGNILITGGTVIAKGGNKAAGIGSGYRNTTCGTITIADTVTQVTATKGTDAPNSIGAGDSGSCGTVTIAPGANVTQN